MDNISYIRTLRLIGRGFLIIITIAFLAFTLLSGAEQEGIIVNSPNAIPALIMLLVIIIVFKWEFIGGVLVAAAGIFTIFFFNAFTELFVLFYLSVPLIFTGVLFMLISHLSTKNLVK